MDKVRILEPVVIGDGIRVRDRIALMDVKDKGDGKRLLKTAHRIEVDGLSEISAYVEYLNLWLPKQN